MSKFAGAGPRRMSGIAEVALTAVVASAATYVLTAAARGRPPLPLNKQTLGIRASGQGASSPTAIPARGWRAILKRTFSKFDSDHITVVAGGVTFSVLLAIFPALTAFVSLYALVADVDDIPGQLQALAAVLPSDAVKLISAELTRLAETRHGGLSIALLFGVVLSFWGASGAMKALFVGMNVAYEKMERRSFLKLNLTTLAFTFGLIVFFATTVAALAADAVVAHLVGPTAGLIVAFARWPFLLLAFGGGVALLYRYGPCREHARWRWVSWGSGAATGLWLAASLLFSFYTSRFSHYDRTYGSLGAAVGLMIWIWISAMIVLFGAEVNQEIERQVRGPEPTA